ncbi:hypothetical protein CO540_19785 [Micromonospora sp. WMMA2032]|uniref:Uncharacterized protein n=1 Tax=Micromonospora sediminicola TaxID=946078 RepID=A0A1A9B3L7_9ACTN|nr:MULTISPECIES: hypothetical protein [Micromonospora]ATO15791.1 hypothetical protein CO540_19785 [Micromonospora sp. WMMA2032]PGH44223.1 hypothetical protein COO58_07115 [Micromonospora sp. WMMA1996]SBT63512.1 hypothetical protein GA0070622_0467 [Micromonospora sediminicola]
MSSDEQVGDTSGQGGRLLGWVFRNLAGPSQVQGAVQGGSRLAREAWKQDLERRKQWSREQRELKRARREARRAGGDGQP